jgi:hypothetical protein
MSRFENLRNNLPEGEKYDSTLPSKGDHVLTTEYRGNLAFGKVSALFCPVPGAIFYDIKTDNGSYIRRGAAEIQVLIKNLEKE